MSEVLDQGLKEPQRWPNYALWGNLLLGDPLGLAYDGFECYNCNHFIIRCLLGI